MYRTDKANLMYDYWNCGDAPPCISFNKYEALHFPSWRSLLTDTYIKENFNSTRLVYATKDDSRLIRIKNEEYKPTLGIKEKLKINHNLKKNRLDQQLTKISTILLPQIKSFRRKANQKQERIISFDRILEFSTKKRVN